MRCRLLGKRRRPSSSRSDESEKLIVANVESDRVAVAYPCSDPSPSLSRRMKGYQKGACYFSLEEEEERERERRKEMKGRVSSKVRCALRAARS